MTEVSTFGVEVPDTADERTRRRFERTLENCKGANMTKEAIEKILTCLLSEQKDRERNR